MQIQPVTNQPNFKGKLVFEKGTITPMGNSTFNPLWKKFQAVSELVSQKPYNLFIMKDLQNDEFYSIAANKTIEDARKIKEYSVKIKSNVMLESIVSAAQDAMSMYEKYICKGAKV